MPWKSDEIRQVKVTLKGPAVNTNDLTITFNVTEAQRSSFETMITAYLNFVEANAGKVLPLEETLDEITHEPCKLSITIKGLNQQLYANTLQANAGAFSHA